MLLLREEEVKTLFPMSDALVAVREAFLEMAGGAAANQPRRRLFLPTGSVLHQMAAWWRNYYGTKIYSTNVRRGALAFHVLLYDAASAEPLALIEANLMGQVRTGAATGVASDALAHAEVESIGLIGTGFQAWTQLEAMLAVRPGVKEVRVFGRDQERREDFAGRATEEFGVNVTAAASAEETVRGAELLATATYAKDPVLENAWVKEGAHVNAAGSNQAARREIPAELVRRASLIAVDSMEQARIEAGDLLLAAPEAEWVSLTIREMGGNVADRACRRPAGVTIFESLGLAVQDVAAAAMVYERALKEGAGQQI